MPNPTVPASNGNSARGFTMVEVIVTMALSLVLMGITFNLLDALNNISDGAIAIADMNQNLRVAVNLIARDLSGAGAEIPLGGIPLPEGGTRTLINRPGPGALTFPDTGTLSVLTPGASLGPISPLGGVVPPAYNTDVITIIGINPNSMLDQFPLTSVTFNTNNAKITVNAGTNIASGASRVNVGDLIMVSNANGSALLTATAVDPVANTVTFKSGDPADVLGVNQLPPQATTGTIAKLQTVGPPASFPSVTAYHLSMVTYYLDTTKPEKLLRQVGTAAPQQVAMGINILQLTYDLADGVTVNVNNPATPNQIRKVNMRVTAKSDHASRKSGLFYSDTINTAITVQNLAFMNKY